MTTIDKQVWARVQLEEHRKILNDLSEHYHRLHLVDFSEPDAYDLPADAPAAVQHEMSQARRVAVLEDGANVFSSRIVGEYWNDETHEMEARHTVAVDIDHRVRVLPSSTEGHYHLYIDVPMPWADYLKLLKVMAEVGLVEPGYVAASERREATHLRLPWVKKDPTDEAKRDGRLKALAEAPTPAEVDAWPL